MVVVVVGSVLLLVVGSVRLRWLRVWPGTQ
jgi:hypothetical protein